MPITQPPTLNVIDQSKGHFAIQFGIFMNEPPANRQTLQVPNIIDATGTLYTIDLSQVNTPARGSIPWIRALSFCFDSRQVEPLAVDPNITPIYIWNSQTNQVVSFIPPPSVPGVAYPSIINGIVPFYCSGSQTIQIFRESGNAALDYWVGSSFTAFTFDQPAYYASESVGWALQT
jgi:hypothetical protein